MTLDEFPSISISNREALNELGPMGTCSCYYCLRYSFIGEISQWVGDMALCPACNIDAVLPGEVDRELLSEGRKRWFGDNG